MKQHHINYLLWLIFAIVFQILSIYLLHLSGTFDYVHRLLGSSLVLTVDGWLLIRLFKLPYQNTLSIYPKWSVKPRPEYTFLVFIKKVGLRSLISFGFSILIFVGFTFSSAFLDTVYNFIYNNVDYYNLVTLYLCIQLINIYYVLVCLIKEYILKLKQKNFKINNLKYLLEDRASLKVLSFLKKKISFVKKIEILPLWILTYVRSNKLLLGIIFFRSVSFDGGLILCTYFLILFISYYVLSFPKIRSFILSRYGIKTLRQVGYNINWEPVLDKLALTIAGASAVGSSLAAAAVHDRSTDAKNLTAAIDRHKQVMAHIDQRNTNIPDTSQHQVYPKFEEPAKSNIKGEIFEWLTGYKAELSPEAKKVLKELKEKQEKDLQDIQAVIDAKDVEIKLEKLRNYKLKRDVSSVHLSNAELRQKLIETEAILAAAQEEKSGKAHLEKHDLLSRLKKKIT